MPHMLSIQYELIELVMGPAPPEGSRDRARIRELLVALGGDPAQAAGLLELLLQSNDGLARVEAILHYLDLEIGASQSWIEDADWYQRAIYGPVSVTGLGLFTGGAIGAIATLGTGGALLVAIGGATIYGSMFVGMRRVRAVRLAMREDEARLLALQRRLISCGEALANRAER